MVKHVMIWSMRDGPHDKAALLYEAKRSLESLSGKIDGLRAIKVSTSPLPSSGADAMVECIFDDPASLAEYKRHPLHAAIANEYIKPFAKTYLSFDTEE